MASTPLIKVILPRRAFATVATTSVSASTSGSTSPAAGSNPAPSTAAAAPLGVANLNPTQPTDKKTFPRYSVPGRFRHKKAHQSTAPQQAKKPNFPPPPASKQPHNTSTTLPLQTNTNNVQSTPSNSTTEAAKSQMAPVASQTNQKSVPISKNHTNSHQNYYRNHQHQQQAQQRPQNPSQVQTAAAAPPATPAAAPVVKQQHQSKKTKKRHIQKQQQQNQAANGLATKTPLADPVTEDFSRRQEYFKAPSMKDAAAPTSMTNWFQQRRKQQQKIQASKKPVAVSDATRSDNSSISNVGFINGSGGSKIATASAISDSQKVSSAPSSTTSHGAATTTRTKKFESKRSITSAEQQQQPSKPPVTKTLTTDAQKDSAAASGPSSTSSVGSVPIKTFQIKEASKGTEEAEKKASELREWLRSLPTGSVTSGTLLKDSIMSQNTSETPSTQQRPRPEPQKPPPFPLAAASSAASKKLPEQSSDSILRRMDFLKAIRAEKTPRGPPQSVVFTPSELPPQPSNQESITTPVSSSTETTPADKAITIEQAAAALKRITNYLRDPPRSHPPKPKTLIF